MTQVMCHRCGITPAEIPGLRPDDFIIPTGNGNEYRCTNCLRYGTKPAEMNRIFASLGRSERDLVTLRAENARTLDRLKLAEDCASLFRDHLAGCADTQRETDALTEWEYAAGVKPVPDTADDYPRAEDMA